ncbi:DNA methyltransferase [Nocardia farcinica]|uniref:DNA methyltransferase n=1 Tax=Nocardia farcinica TaxID=37329 RepID=UPI0024581180|nr:DNA methyltransferase [Nocardia farcinica]
MRTLRDGELTHGVDPADYPDYTVHGVYPWTVLDGRAGEWQARKKWWRGLPCDETGGRDEHLLLGARSSERHRRISGGTSRFDPMLAEVLITWYTPPGGLIVDPFAGGAVRGVVADRLGRHYVGIDLSERQAAANREVSQGGLARWVTGDAVAEMSTMPDGSADAVLTCPPYHCAERYSDDPRDLSVMSWAEHLAAVEAVAVDAYRVLADDRFLVWVTGDLRGPDGHLRQLPEHTARLLVGAGFRPVNHHILVTPVGTMYRMLRRWWTNTSSAGRVHQHVWVMVKGDRRRATAAARGGGTPPSAVL